MNFYSINRGLYKRLHSYFSYQSTKFQYRTKIKKLIKTHNCKNLSKIQVREIKEYYASFGFKNINTNWHQFHSHMSGKYFREYIPEDLFYSVIVPHLNRVKTHAGLTDKNLLNKLFKGVKQPETIIKNINGFYYDGKENKIIQIKEVLKKCNNYSSLIIKPSIDSGGGKNVMAFNLMKGITDFNDTSVDNLIQSFNKDFIIQKFITQHEKMSLLNPTSINTIRITSLLINDEVEILGRVVRIGGIYSRVDNTSQGGIWCKIKGGGILSERGYNKLLNSVLETDSKIKLKDFVIPNYDKIIKEVKILHKQIPYFRFVSWDFAIDSTGETVLVEYNVRAPGIDGQFIHGPLFGKFTSEILNYCKINKFSFLRLFK